MKLSTRMIQILEKRKLILRSKCICTNKGCEICNEQFQRLVKYAQANIPIKYWDLSLSEYIQNDKYKDLIVQYVKNLTENYENGTGLYLQGNVGLGKTFLACIICKAAIRKGYKARFSTLAEAITLLSETFYDKGAREDFQKEILEVDFLVVDEIEKVSKSTKSDFIEASMDMLFRTRLNQLLPVIITSNKTKEELAEEMASSYGASLVSLFNEHLVTISFTGNDYRKVIQKTLREKTFNITQPIQTDASEGLLI